MEYTFTVTASQLYAVGFCIFIALLLYIYTKDDGDDHLTHMRHDIEMKKEWYRMLAVKHKADLKNGKNNVIRRL